jgi:hypothetical protein
MIERLSFGAISGLSVFLIGGWAAWCGWVFGMVCCAVLVRFAIRARE